jgi:hypothetical protein
MLANYNGEASRSLFLVALFGFAFIQLLRCRVGVGLLSRFFPCFSSFRKALPVYAKTICKFLPFDFYSSISSLLLHPSVIC